MKITRTIRLFPLQKILLFNYNEVTIVSMSFLGQLIL